MKIFKCHQCTHPISFDNFVCSACGSPLGFLSKRKTVSTLVQREDGWEVPAYRRAGRTFIRLFCRRPLWKNSGLFIS